MSGARHVEVVANPHARRGRRLGDVLERLPGRHHVVDEPDRLGSVLQESATRRPERVIVAGGDGTVAAAVQVLAGSGIPLAIIPLGTQDNFANSLGIPAKLEAACHLATTGRAHPVDVGCADGTLFANAMTLGVSGRIARRTGPLRKRLLGQVAYGLAAVGVLARQPPFSVRIRWPGGEKSVRTHQIIVASGRRIGGTVAAPGADAADGLLEVRTLGGPTRRGLAKAWLRARGRKGVGEASIHVRTTEVHIDADPPQRVDLDGELHGHTPVRAWIVRHGIDVVRPEPEA